MRKTLSRLALGGVLTSLALTASAGTAELRKSIATGLLTRGIGAGERDYILRHVAEDYIQHNPQVADGRAGLLNFLDYADRQWPGRAITPLRVLADGDLVLVHSEADFAGAVVVFDLFRFEGETITEHWDAIQPRAESTRSGRTMTDGPLKPTDLDKTDANRALVRDFVQEVLIGGDTGRLPAYIAAPYAQHNPLIGDGLEGLAAFLGELAAQGVSFSYKRLHNIVAEGSFVFTQSEGELAGEPTAFYDLFRVEEGQIVEHWDVIQPIPAEMAHGNGMF